MKLASRYVSGFRPVYPAQAEMLPLWVGRIVGKPVRPRYIARLLRKSAHRAPHSKAKPFENVTKTGPKGILLQYWALTALRARQLYKKRFMGVYDG